MVVLHEGKDVGRGALCGGKVRVNWREREREREINEVIHNCL